MTSYKNLMSGLFLLLMSVPIVQAESNCFIRLPSDAEKANSLANRELIESYGGRIIHEFPATGEFICWMAPSQFDRWVQECD